jgi:hypothetical protein
MGREKTYRAAETAQQNQAERTAEEAGAFAARLTSSMMRRILKDVGTLVKKNVREIRISVDFGDSRSRAYRLTSRA